ncbi:MAG: hypothetical protein DGJ47_000204 [Rickettsiaceae bacterium]
MGNFSNRDVISSIKNVFETLDEFGSLEKNINNNLDQVQKDQIELVDHIENSIAKAFDLKTGGDVKQTAEQMVDPVIKGTQIAIGDITKEVMEEKTKFRDSVKGAVVNAAQYDKNLESISDALDSHDAEKQQKDDLKHQRENAAESYEKELELIEKALNSSDNKKEVQNSKSDRVREYLGNKLNDAISEAKDGINHAKKSLSEVEIDKKQVKKKAGEVIVDAVDIAFSNTLIRPAGMVASLVTLQPLTIGLTAAAGVIGIGNDYAITSDTIKQDKVYNNLMKHNNARAEQESLSLKKPGLVESLETSLSKENKEAEKSDGLNKSNKEEKKSAGLYKPNKEGKKSVKKEYKPKSKARMAARAVLPVVAERGLYAVDHATSLATTGNPLSAVLLVNDFRGTLTDTHDSYSKIKHNEKTRQLSDTQRKHRLAPGYDNLQELKQCASEQIKQTKSLDKTVKFLDKMGINKVESDNDKKIATRAYKINKAQIDSQEKKVANYTTMWDKIKVGAKRVLNNIKHTINPTSDYVHPKRLKKRREKPNIHIENYDYQHSKAPEVKNKAKEELNDKIIDIESKANNKVKKDSVKDPKVENKVKKDSVKEPKVENKAKNLVKKANLPDLSEFKSSSTSAAAPNAAKKKGVGKAR